MKRDDATLVVSNMDDYLTMKSMDAEKKRNYRKHLLDQITQKLNRSSEEESGNTTINL